jgi:hypothetical protein
METGRRYTGDLQKINHLATKTKPEECYNGQVLNMKDDSALLIDLKLKSAAIATSALSEDGSYVAAADSRCLRIFKLNYDEDQVVAQKLTSILPKGVTANRLVFTQDSLRLIVAGNNHSVYVINLGENRLEHEFTEHSISDPGNAHFVAHN